MSDHPADKSGPDSRTSAGTFNAAARRGALTPDDFTARYQNRIAQLSPAAFLEACEAYESLAATPGAAPDFFTREIAALPEPDLLEKMAAPGLSRFAPFLAELRRVKDYRLSAPAENYQTDMREVGADAWHRLYDMHRAARAPEKSFALVLNTLLQLEQVDDAARGFESPGEKTLLRLRLSAPQLEWMDKAARASYAATTQKFASLSLPPAPAQSQFTTAEAGEILQEALVAFSPALAAEALAAFTREAPAASFTPQALLSAARELGTTMQRNMAAAAGPLYQTPPPLLGATLGIFVENLVLAALLPRLGDPLEQARLLASATEKRLADMQHPAMLSGFERRLQAEHRDKGELAAPRINALWQEACRQESGSVPPAGGWTVESGIFKTPHESLASAAEGVTAHSIFAAWRASADKPSFAETLLAGLAAGGAANPQSLLKTLGCDPEAMGFWKQGFAEAGRYIDDIAKRLSSRAKGQAPANDDTVAAANNDAAAPARRRQKGPRP